MKLRTFPLALAWLLVLGAAGSLLGAYWDDVWHTERGRDSFWIAPHIAIYAGVALTGAALSLWALGTAVAAGAAAPWRHPPLALGLAGVIATLASAPIDDGWHAAFGRDAVIWSPPHMLGIVGTVVMGIAVLAELTGRSGRAASAARGLIAGLTLAGAAFTVAEYETDVPQFDVAWYLPALTLAATLVLAVVRRLSERPWAATEAAAVQLAFLIVMSAFLAATDFLPPALPLLLAPALVIDLGARRGWGATRTGLTVAASMYLVHVPVRNLLGDGIHIDGGDVVAGLPLSALAAVAVLEIAAGRPWRALASSPVTAIVLAAAIAGYAAAPAVAHDPGQGEPAGTLDLGLTADAETVRMRADLPADLCAHTEAVRMVARRAGRVVSGPLHKRGCVMTGRLEPSEAGRWFVYAELERDGRRVESWLPITVGEGPAAVGEDRRFAYHPPQRESGVLKLLGGVALYAMMAALLVAAIRLTSTRPVATRDPGRS